MRASLERNPVRLTLGIAIGLFVYGVAARPTVEALAPALSILGVRVALNWLFVVLVVGLVAWLGWWSRIRLTAPIAPGGRRYLLVLGALVLVPLVGSVLAVPDAFHVPEASILAGRPLSAAGVVLLVVVGFALGAAIQEELLFRGVVLRGLESRGRLQAALAASLLFGVSHLSLLAVDVPVQEVLVVAVLSTLNAVGLAAITFRVGSLWPLLVWHFLQDIAPSFLTAPALGVYFVVAAVLGLLVAALGAWLLWNDRHVTERDPTGRTPVSSD